MLYQQLILITDSINDCSFFLRSKLTPFIALNFSTISATYTPGLLSLVNHLLALFKSQRLIFFVGRRPGRPLELHPSSMVLIGLVY